MKIHDICMLPNQNLQFAVSAPLKYGQLGRPEFDLVAGFTQPIDETTDRESTYLVEYDLQFRNKQFMSSSALLAARTCHIFHLLTCLRENFYRSTVEWEAISGQFHNNVFGTVYSKYEEESNGLMADFALDFISYIITGNYSEAFSQAFFNDIKLKDWKPAREFVGKHIPSFLQTINRYLSPIVEILYVHLNSLKGELERFERNSTCQWGQRRVFAMFGAKTGDVSKTVEQVSKCIQAVCHLSGRLKHLAMVASKNWAELKYVLQLLSSHPDNEQLKIEIEDDYDGIPKLVDFEILLNFISEALVDPAKKEGFGGWTNFLHHWKTILAEEEPTRRDLICNPNWLKHRLFDKIGPLLGICTDLPKPPPPSRENVENKFDCSHATTINDSIDLCFKTLSDVYLFGLKDLDGNSEQPSYAKSHCLEFCHPHPISKLQLFSWPDVEETKKYQKLEDQQENLSSLNNLKQKVGTTELKSLILIHRSSTSTLQTYACVGSHLQPHDSAQVNICSPEHVLKLGVFGQSGEIQSRFEKLHADEIEQSYEDGQFKVLSFEPYGMGVLHLAVSFNEHKNPETGVYILRVNVNGQLKKIDTNVLTYADDPILMTSPSSSTAIMFEKGFEAVKWFDLEDKNSRLRRKSLVAEPESHILKAHSIQKIDIPGHSTRSALNRKRKLNAAQQQDENARPSTADLMEMDRKRRE
ncbi:hypothetical protein M3Y97_01114700 [Aphelenchoides bicaudatus]|nr:hypothetical protein M3Y97_01114700 [Aphelenchoides bicaudatus]